MSAVFRAARGGLGGRRLQAVIIGLVVLVATAASTLALGMLADAHSPFDHGFAVQHGAQVAVTVDTSAASAAQLANAAHANGVTAVAGPFPSADVTAQVSLPGVNGTIGVPLTLVGRSSPGGPVDDLTLQQGHWPASDNQVVLSVNASGPGQVGSTITIGKQVLTVTGIANSVTNTADAWVLPAEIDAPSPAAGARARRNCSTGSSPARPPATSRPTSARSRPRCRRTRSSAPSPTSPSASPSSQAWPRGCRSSSRSA